MKRPWFSPALLIGLAAVCFLAQDTAALRRSVPVRPPVMLWAWERPEDLAFIDLRSAGVAFLAGTVRISCEGTFVIVPRRQPMRVPEHTLLTAVFRIEPERCGRSGPPRALASGAASALTDIAGAYEVAAVQIDFDARTSERPFYRALLKELRRRLPDNVSLSMTALASWCIYDRWLGGLPVDEAVPMLFRMGPEGGQLVRYLDTHGDFREPLCRMSLGISTDEPVGRLPLGRTIYVFSPTSWTSHQFTAFAQEASQWR